MAGSQLLEWYSRVVLIKIAENEKRINKEIARVKRYEYFNRYLPFTFKRIQTY